jgi:hypothetical protein
MKLRCSISTSSRTAVGQRAAPQRACRPRTVYPPLLKVFAPPAALAVHPHYRSNPSGSWHGRIVPKAATGACAQAGDLPNGTHQKSIYTESQWQTQAVGHLDLAAQRTDQTEDHRLASLAASATSRVTSSSRRARASLNCASRCLKISVDGHPEETCRERLRSRIISRSRPR